MLRTVRSHLTYANVMATIAVFGVLGGGAYAATAAKNTVTSKSIKNGQVKLGDLATDSVDSAKVLDDSLTGTDVNESSLALPAPQLAAGSVTGLTIADGSVAGTDIIAPAAWQPLVPGLHWALSANSDYRPASCYKDQLGVVHLRGLLVTTAAFVPANYVAATLSTACSPQFGQEFLAAKLAGGTPTGNGFAEFYLDNSGAVRIESAGPGALAPTDSISLDGISFRPTD
ncbi:MAG: hypothetical protein QOG62_1755 [Thermoleophilaceae bacterium]|jgi:hypothetical protein|nr:hypothetical protein [Thermoleophilaceae bacterium]